MYLLIGIAITILFIVIMMYILKKSTQEPLTENVSFIEDLTQFKKSCEESSDYPISCQCPELATWHPGRVQHKMTCPIFRKLNPNLTVKQFLKYEGFPIDDDEEWPELK